MKYFIGLDGGGTKTKCILTDENYNSIYECTGGPSNFLMLGTEKVSETIFNLINEAITNSKINEDDLEAVLIGTTGAGLKETFLNYSHQKNLKLKNFFVESDARIALEGAFSGKPGSILIAGTGSIMFGKDKNGVIHRVGGCGRFIGDEGSGFMIGRKGLIAVSKHLDGRGNPTLLTDFLRSEFNIDDLPTLITKIYKENFDIASVTPFVIKAAEENDIACLKILEEESDELTLHVKAIHNLLKEETLKLSLIGSTITTENLYAKMFQEKINDLGNVKLQDPDYPPAIGAVIMAKNLS
jgi:N-acetylglucosamine kinase-like BadF-type ATPase